MTAGFVVKNGDDMLVSLSSGKKGLGRGVFADNNFLFEGECLPGALLFYFLLTIPTSAPDLPSHGEAPQVDHVALHTFPTKHVA